MIRLGVVGCGHWGPNLIRTLQNLPNAEVAGICDTNAQRLAALRALYPTTSFLESFDDLLALSGLDAVCIATPVATHHPLALRALQAGKHVLLEKPLTMTTLEGEELIAVAKASGLVLCVGHIFLYNQAVRYVKDFLDAGKMGEIYYLYFTRTNLGPVRDDVGAMWDLAPHDISIATYWMGREPVRVRASGHTYLPHERKDVVFAELIFANGVVAHLHVSWLDPCKVRRTTIIGSEKMLVYSDTDAIAPITIYDKRVDPVPFADTLAAFQMSIRDGDIHIPKISAGEPLKTECRHFLECVQNNTRPMTDGANGLSVVHILTRLEESMAKGGVLVDV